MANREIKFRAWDIKYKGFSEEPFFRILVAKDGQIYNSENDEWTKPGERYIINLSTGLLDKNGKEIYHRDILKFKASTGESLAEVVWLFDGWQLRWIKRVDALKNWHGVDTTKITTKKLIKSEVVGNAFENPNLLSTSVSEEVNK